MSAKVITKKNIFNLMVSIDSIGLNAIRNDWGYVTTV